MTVLPDGYYPRLNAAMLATHVDMIVSLVGKLTSSSVAGVQMQCADGGMIRLSTEQGELPQLASPDTVVEIIGLVISPHEVSVRICKLLRDDVVCCCERSFSLTLNSLLLSFLTILLRLITTIALCHTRTFRRYGFGDVQ